MVYDDQENIESELKELARGGRVYKGTCVFVADALKANLQRVFDVDKVDTMMGRLRNVLPKPVHEDGKH